jgi:hypothetical protein
VSLAINGGGDPNISTSTGGLPRLGGGGGGGGGLHHVFRTAEHNELLTKHEVM